jgi:LL-diaminopimelate aminotransferase
MATINPHYDKLQAGYLFPEIGRRTREFVEANGGVEVMRLGIGDTTEPLTPSVIEGLHVGVDQLASANTYSGYGDSEGIPELREALAARYAGYGANIDIDDIWISDGAKPDSANIQTLFGQDNVVAFQDPAYPVYVDSNVIGGRAGEGKDGQYDGLVYMPCRAENEFFPPVPNEKVDLIYLCSPNNPTGAVATHDQLKTFVDYANEQGAVIIFDAAYAAYISDPSLPRSIYEVDGAKSCAIEINSFSKEAGFTGVRLGWTIVPQALRCENAEPGKLNAMWRRRQNTVFNGASNIVQAGGVAVLSEKGQRETKEMVAYYMANAATIRSGLEAIGLTVYGGENAPYVWLETPNELPSWDFFDKLLNETHVVGTPGAGFGPSGEGYFRLSAFGAKESVAQAMASISQNLSL